MTHPVSPCNENCPTPMWCFENNCVARSNNSGERHDEEPDDFLCPEDITCESQETCIAIGFCHKQMQHPAQTAWYRRIKRLNDIVGEHQVWLLSGNIGDICVVDQWLSFECEPSPYEKIRMLVADTWLAYVEARMGTRIAHAWFIGSNFDGQPAYVALSNDQFHLIEKSAKVRTGPVVR